MSFVRASGDINIHCFETHLSFDLFPRPFVLHTLFFPPDYCRLKNTINQDINMATRTFARAIKSQPATSAFKSSTRTSFLATPRQAFRSQHQYRSYASSSTKSSSSSLLLGIGALSLAGAGGYYFYTTSNGSLLSGSSGETSGLFTPKFSDYQKVYNEIAKRLEEKDDYDDGSYGPVLVRLAWHASGTYDVETGTGGSNGATMRFQPEGDHGANAGLKAARDFLEPVKGEFLISACGFLPKKMLRIRTDGWCRTIPMDLLLRPLDPLRRLRHPRNARPNHPLPTRPSRQRYRSLYT